MVYLNRFLDKAAIVTPQDQINPNGSVTDPWNLCSMQQVEEVKCLLRVLPIWVSGILYFVVIVQQHTILVFQALLSDRRIGQSGFLIPGASYYVFLMISVAIWLPVYDRKSCLYSKSSPEKRVASHSFRGWALAYFSLYSAC